MQEIFELISRYYDRDPVREWERMDRHPMEFAVTWKALEAHLPAPPATILDCGGGPGRYAIELARRGYQVTLFDLSTENLRLAREKAKEAGVQLAAFEQGTALDLSLFAPDSFDAVLLLGPLYHLLEADERKQALVEARRVLHAGGMLFAAFISRYGAHRDAARKSPTEIIEFSEVYDEVLRSGRLLPRGPEETEFIGYLAHPSELSPLVSSAGLEVVATLGVEGLVSMNDSRVNQLSGAAWERWVALNYQVASDPTIHGCVGHLLVIARKPRWRTVLRNIVSRLDEAGLTYKLVGGASSALQGVSMPVKDLDFELSADAVYRFQSLFPEHVIEPVKLSHSETYRSHFGKLKFAEVVVEIMGDIQRREGDRWVSTETTTETRVALDDIQVNVSWLEEETLAYIRRGRLERAAQCLLHCDAAKLLSLLRGEPAPGVL